MKIRLILLIALFILINPATSFSFQNEPDGFRNYKWGTSIINFNKLVFSRPHNLELIMEVDTSLGKVQVFQKNDDITKFLDVNIDKINYYFYKNMFYMVEIVSLEPTKFEKSIISTYGIVPNTAGNQSQSNAYVSRRNWTGETTFIKFEYYRTFNGKKWIHFGEFNIKSKEISNLINSKEN